MGPDSPNAGASSSATVPSRPRFTWDIRSPPWTDGRGNQDHYLDAVKLWKEFQDALPDTNSNKITPNLQGIVLKAQLFGRARDLCAKVSIDDLKKSDGALILARAVYKVDPLAQVNKMSQQFTRLLLTRRNTNESLKEFESRFDAQVSTFHDAAGSQVLPDALLALMLMSNAEIDNAQRVSLLASVAPSGDKPLVGKDLLDAIKYEKVASIIRSSDALNILQQRSSFRAYTAVTRSVAEKTRIDELKKKTKCKACDGFGHWWNDDECPLKQKNANDKSVANNTQKPKTMLHF